LGEHGAEILRDAGYTPTEIADLVVTGVCSLPGTRGHTA
jgi:hypothetical protein